MTTTNQQPESKELDRETMINHGFQGMLGLFTKDDIIQTLTNELSPSMKYYLTERFALVTPSPQLDCDDPSHIPNYLQEISKIVIEED